MNNLYAECIPSDVFRGNISFYGLFVFMNVVFLFHNGNAINTMI
jgi:hypothetical protein